VEKEKIAKYKRNKKYGVVMVVSRVVRVKP